jgi:hypothetical protein
MVPSATFSQEVESITVIAQSSHQHASAFDASERPRLCMAHAAKSVSLNLFSAQLKSSIKHVTGILWVL